MSQSYPKPPFPKQKQPMPLCLAPRRRWSLSPIMESIVQGIRTAHWQEGGWTIGRERAVLDRKTAVSFTGSMRAIYLVLGPGPDGKPVRFRITIDGRATRRQPRHGCHADGQGVVTGQRLYQLVRQSDAIADHTFEIRFLDPGVQAYAITFG
jgi:Thioredoxin like C-terminal domain